KSCGIPFFLDQKRTILHHPLVEFIRSALEVVNGNWRADAVFRCIKSSYLFPLASDAAQRRYWRDQVSRLENYVLAFGIKGAAWQPENRWHFIYRDTLELEEELQESLSQADLDFLEEIDQARRSFSSPLLSFQEKFKASPRVKDRVLALYNLLQSVSVIKQLELATKQALAEGDPDKSREQEQVYRGIISLLEQLTEIIGEEEVSAVFFARLIDTGLSALRLGMAPPSLDQVIVGNLERTRIGNLRALFLLGVNEGVLPSRPGGEVIFTEAELEIMEAQGFHLSPGPWRRLLDEEFLIYLSLTRASDMLWVSYALADTEGKALLPSILINRLQELFPALVVRRQTAEPQEPEDSLLPFIFHPRQTLSILIVQLGRWKRGEPLHSLWWEVYNWYANGGGEKEEAKRLLGGLFYYNREDPLTPRTSRELYGQALQTGATRLERFCSCPFAHFAAYGLRLRQRLLYGLETPDTGRFFHAALRNVTSSLQEHEKHWGDWEKDELLKLVSAEVSKLLPRLQQEIMLSSRRYLHLAKKMEETVGRAALILAEHDRRSEFKPIAAELAFEEKGGRGLPPLRLQLTDGSTVDLVGRIDRLDQARTEDGRLYLRIIDYKSGNTSLDLVEFYHGLSLQLILYLEAVLSCAREWLGETALPAGVFYFRVHDPLISSSGPLTPQTLQTEMLKRFKLAGILLADPAVVRLMDKELQSGYSPVVPAAINKQGNLYGIAKSLQTASNFAELCRHVRTIASDAAGRILQGRLEISPCHIGHKKACTYCLYKAVCQFDLLLDENRYRRLAKVPEKL
ncbi:MAG TPA: helicase-exonuclease AddAB subunit AddB, partial [Firmicutes bacterium]|nr:helicase-exonuclease AddAB subunit AddB [Bacillota bacterium]